MKINKRVIDECTTCNSCTAFCPVAAVTREFPGPKLVGPAGERLRKQGGRIDAALTYCTNCKTCEITCPNGVPVAAINMAAKANYYRQHGHSLRDWILAHGELMAKLATPVSWLANLGMANPLTRKILKALGIAADKRALPAYAARTLNDEYRNLRQQPFADKVVFFPGCYISNNEPRVGLDLIAVLQKNGYEVILPPGLNCCGVPMVTGAYIEDAAAAGRRNIAILAEYVRRGYPVLTCCTSCGQMLKQEYCEQLAVGDEAAAVAAKTYDAMEFLLELHENGRLNTDFRFQAGRYLYHAPCHLRAQGIGRPALEILGLLPGIEVTDADAGCCGIAGSYGFKDDRYDISMAVGAALFAKIREVRPDAVLTDCGTCRMQITHATGAKALHPLAVLRKAYEPAYKL